MESSMRSILTLSYIAVSFFASTLSICFAQNANIDQPTWDLLQGLVKKKLPAPQGELWLVQSVKLTNVKIDPDLSRRTSIAGEPTTAQIFHAVNCTPRDQIWKREIVYTTKTVITVEMEKTVTTTETVTVDAKATFFEVVSSSINYKFEKQVKVNEKQTQVFEDEKKITVTEEHKIPPNTRLYVRVVEKTETTTFPLVGSAIVDAQLQYHYLTDVTWSTTSPVWISAGNLLPQPKDRLVSLEGLTTIGTVETIDVVFEERRVDPGDPECNVVDPPDLKSFSG
jgi:hypothetical protein